MRWLSVTLFLIGCGSHAPPATPRASCTATRAIRVVDESGAPLPGARIQAIARYSSCGPSGLPEGCLYPEDASPVVTTDATGTATVCSRTSFPGFVQPAAQHGSSEIVRPVGRDRLISASIIASYGDWPATQLDDGASTVVLGPARSVIVEARDCDRVRVVSARGGATFFATALPDSRFEVAGLGPGSYWMTSEATASVTCTSFTRLLDASHPPPTFVLDHNEARVDYPAFAGGNVTVTAGEITRAAEPLDAAGTATLVLPETSGNTFCVRLEKDDRCLITEVRTGGQATPASPHRAPADLERMCGRC